ncbi:MAG TPA: GTPase [Miltoncostaeaceae bacterium]|nr:GTPase [Miltoncostaeaceae bacterium]
MFTDRARIHVEGGHGGGGAVSFRRERYIPRGGPDGGNGGRGGSVVLVADVDVVDLSRFRHAVHHRARPGGNGEGRARHGRAGADLEVRVPPGTRVLRDGHVIADLRAPGDRVPVARGGEGGVGNRVFRSSTHQAPREAVPGMPGERAWLTLEFRLPVDAVLVGLPNAGKSALLRALTGAGATVAAYPHSTREPALGPLEDPDGRLHLVADLPGLAADGTPRADAHLEQAERARVVLHCVDVSDPEPAEDRIARVRAGVAPFLGPDAEEWVVATNADPDERPAWAQWAVEADLGLGIDALRAALAARLRGAPPEAG